MTIRIPCPACQEQVRMSSRGRLHKHGDCPKSGKPVGRIWPTRHHGRRVRTIPGPDTWNPKSRGAA
ncbi:hypothetical protein [Streptomyces sp. NPDC059916]|uniref:hypothetical protein n=1 Tax=Streptomyces sp. NPDC059916 TaxID=3347001 RepID=UPI0036A6D160